MARINLSRGLFCHFDRYFFLFERLKRLWFSDFSIAESFYYLEHLGPGWKGSLVFFFIAVNGHNELELLVGHLAFLGGFPLVGSASSRAATTVKAQASVEDVFPSVICSAAFYDLAFTQVHSLKACNFIRTAPSGQLKAAMS